MSYFSMYTSSNGRALETCSRRCSGVDCLMFSLSAAHPCRSYKHSVLNAAALMDFPKKKCVLRDSAEI